MNSNRRTMEIISVPNAVKNNGKPEVCTQCAMSTGQWELFCGLMGSEYEDYVLDCLCCGKTIVDQFGRCTAANCRENHGGKWHLTFDKNGALLKIYDPVTDQSLIDKNDERS